MAQNFVTVNEQTYIWHDYRNRTESAKQPEAIYDVAPKSDIWIGSGASESGDFRNATDEDLKKFVAKLYKRRNWTTFQISYCRKELIKDDHDEQVELSENELIEGGKRIYSEPTKKIMKPLPTARKLYGYLRPHNMYTGITTYQDVHGKLGYEILLKDYNYLQSLKNKT